MIETREKNINGSTYTVTQLPARRALRLKAKLMRLFGPVLAQIYLTVAEKVTDEQKKADFVTAIELLGKTIDENTFESFIMELLEGVRKNGMELKPATIDIEFAGDLATLYQVSFFVLEVNFENFFQMIGTGLQSESSNPQPAPIEEKKTFTRRYC